MAIPVNDARNTFTKLLVEKYIEQPKPSRFLSSFFKENFVASKEVSIEVRRGTEKVAVDIMRHGEGNYNKITRSTEKVFVPPYYSDYITANDNRLYDVAIGTQHAPSFAQLISESALDVVSLRDKQLRAYELQAAQVLQTGIITLNSTTDIDFKRKAASMVDGGSGTYWTVDTVDPIVALKNGCEFLRKTGKFSGGVVNAIFGSSALEAMLNNPLFQAKADLRNVDLMMIKAETKNAEGGVPHGIVTAGSWKVIVWTYPEYYENASGTMIPYIDPTKVVMLPESTNFTMAFGLVPQLLEDNGVGQTGAFLMREFIDERKKAHEIFIESAGIAIPTAIDQIYTVKVTA